MVERRTERLSFSTHTFPPSRPAHQHKHSCAYAAWFRPYSPNVQFEGMCFVISTQPTSEPSRTFGIISIPSYGPFSQMAGSKNHPARTPGDESTASVVCRVLCVLYMSQVACRGSRASVPCVSRGCRVCVVCVSRMCVENPGVAATRCWKSTHALTDPRR